jgi:hypothetical protein
MRGEQMAESLQESVKLHEQFRDLLIINKYDPQLELWHKRKLRKQQSENSEDSMVWNVFKTLDQIDRKLWIENLFFKAFQFEIPYSYPIENIAIKLWKRIHPPNSLQLVEGQTEIDIIIESDEFVWFIEAKYKSDISLRTTNDSNRNKIIQNIDVGTNYAKKKDFYYSLLILDKYNSPMGFRMTNEYKASVESVVEMLPHRNELPTLKGISVLTWQELQLLFKTIYLYSKNKYEKFIADQASYWLLDKIRDDH